MIAAELGAVQQGEPSEFDAAALLVHSGRDFAGAAQMLRHYVSEEDPSEDGPAFRAHYLLGVLLEKQGKKKEAEQDFAKAFSIDPGLRAQYKDFIDKWRAKSKP